ncbi:MAG: SH3 domain-containing protein [Sphingomonas sp.]|uniref:SH3 domain-containing protein n=1 Tax=Sphingomonas sp. TaxID=28214 RepID=UPI0025DC75B2|nr:SH3 domain-containing protein [Sphingomonas sp.]MBX3564802.1 SH3 domain-containing protein [Sphingomonas sp.]
MRPDLADVRLADRVFAPHYAAPMPREIAATVTLRAGPAADSEALAELHSGDVFEVLELAGTNAWGVARAKGLVGYIHASALAAPAK